MDGHDLMVILELLEQKEEENDRRHISQGGSNEYTSMKLMRNAWFSVMRRSAASYVTTHLRFYLRWIQSYYPADIALGSIYQGSSILF